MKSKKTCIRSGKSKCLHKCKWKKTGAERYSFPGQYEEECQSCHEKRWKEYKNGIPIVKSGSKEWEEFRKRHINGN